jgi:hypothetical protein
VAGAVVSDRFICRNFLRAWGNRAMRIEQAVWKEAIGWTRGDVCDLAGLAQLVLVFGSTHALNDNKALREARELYPSAHIFGCSTAGEISGTTVSDDSIVSTAIHFEHTRIEGTSIVLGNTERSFEAGQKISASLNKPGLVHIFVLSDGLKVNGSDLVRGLMDNLPDGITVTGGLAADGGRFSKTLTIWDSDPAENTVAGIGFYGDRLKIGYGSLGGWDPFGTERLITRSAGNVLYELDGQSALELYKKYLGDHADGLPATGLLFPLSLRTNESDSAVVRTILAINEKDQSMTFAGDMPEGSYARLMKANFDRIIDGATGAAKTCFEAAGSVSPALAILISCVGRKMILKQRTEEEVEGVKEILGPDTVITGFYSYGEISPFAPNVRCELHNQTMTITTLSES